jgi:hypothetical protein
LKKIKKYFYQSLSWTILHKKPFCVGLLNWWIIIKISGIQIFTEIEIFEKVVHFLKNRAKKWEHPKFFWYTKKNNKKKLANPIQWILSTGWLDMEPLISD